MEALVATLAREAEHGDVAALENDALQAFVAALLPMRSDASWLAVISEREMARWFRRS
jgi:hypothetical protein